MPESFRILAVTATQAEADAVRRISGTTGSAEVFKAGNCSFELLVTGVGSMSTAWALSKWLSANPLPDLVINAGIAGSYRDDIGIGEVVLPVSDCFADAGIETMEEFVTLAEAGLQDANKFPFRNGQLTSENKYTREFASCFKPVKAITVNTATGTDLTIKKLVRKYDPDIETMEGAAFFYICLRENIPFIAFRSVSNKVEPRDRSKWNIELALKNLADKLGEFVLMINS
jgi:futalosine hydrolase